MRHYEILYGEAQRIPASLQSDLDLLLARVGSWRAQVHGDYKETATEVGFEVEKRMESLGRKRLDLFKAYPNAEIEYRVAIEIETSTIENGYNDLLKIMQLLKADEVDYGVVLFVQNDRSTRPKLTAPSLRSNLVEALNRVLEDFRGKLFLLHFRASESTSGGT